MAIEILVRLGVLLSPSFFAILAGLSLTAAVLLFVAGKGNGVGIQVESGKLSRLEPTEHRHTVYLILAFGWSVIGLVLSFISGAIGIRAFWSVFLVILLLLCLLFTLCFLYAGAGALLRAVTGRRGGLVSRFFPPVRYVDALVVRFGDVLAAGLFRQSRYPGGVTEVGVPTEVKEVPGIVRGGHKKSKVAEEKVAEAMERLQRILAEYEDLLTPQQKEKFVKMKRIAEELRNMYS